MKRLKFSLVLLFIFLMVVFNLERLEWNAGIELGIHSFVYILALIIVVLMTALSNKIQRGSIFVVMALSALIYFGFRLTLYNTPPLFEGVNTYVTVTELAILLISSALTYEFACQLGQIEQLVEGVFMPTDLGKRILDSDAAVEDIKTEFTRSRRHSIPLTLMVIRPSNTPSSKIIKEVNIAVQVIQRGMARRFISASLAKIISTVARRTDLIVSQGDDELFHIICPETKGEDVICLVERIQEMVEENLGIPVSYGIATFPDDALTYDELVNRAESQLSAIKPQPAEA